MATNTEKRVEEFLDVSKNLNSSEAPDFDAFLQYSGEEIGVYSFNLDQDLNGKVNTDEMEHIGSISEYEQSFVYENKGHSEIRREVSESLIDRGESIEELGEELDGRRASLGRLVSSYNEKTEANQEQKIKV